MSDRDEAMLVLLAQAGDREALGALLQRVQPALRGYLRMLKRDAAAADDLLQDTFVIAVRKLRFLRDPVLFRSWIFRIATREAHRRTRPAPGAFDTHHEPVAGGGPELALMDAESRERLREDVARLPDRAREVIVLHFFEEMTLEETAAVLEAPLGTVKSRLAYGLGLLRRHGGAR